MGNEWNVVKQVPECLLDFRSKKNFKGLPGGPTDQQGTINFLRDTPLTSQGRRAARVVAGLQCERSEISDCIECLYTRKYSIYHMKNSYICFLNPLMAQAKNEKLQRGPRNFAPPLAYSQFLPPVSGLISTGRVQ